jgi:general stress protein YciG
MAKEKLSVQESGKRGGEANAAAHDTEHFKALGKAGGAATKAKFGRAHYQEIGRKGGQAKAKKDDAL